MKKGILIGALAGGLTLGAGVAEAGDIVGVANGAELAAAIEAANSDSTIRVIRCQEKAACDVVGTLPVYTGAHPLTIDGHSSTIDATGITDEDGFASVGGGAVKLVRLNFVGGLSGIYVEVPGDKTGGQRVELKRVTVRDAGQHGVFVSDQAYSVAGVRLFISKSKFFDNGFDGMNREGVRVNETSKGKIKAIISDSFFGGNAADGISLNERGGGGVLADVVNSRFVDNGSNPGESGNPEDGFDIDEFGAGDVWLTVRNSYFNRNFDDGLDVDENESGSLYVDLDGIFAKSNRDQGVTLDETKIGDVEATISNSTIVNNDVSEGYDIKAVQNNSGGGTLMLDNVVTDDWWLSGVVLTLVP